MILRHDVAAGLVLALGLSVGSALDAQTTHKKPAAKKPAPAAAPAVATPAPAPVFTPPHNPMTTAETAAMVASPEFQKGSKDALAEYTDYAKVPGQHQISIAPTQKEWVSNLATWAGKTADELKALDEGSKIDFSKIASDEALKKAYYEAGKDVQTRDLAVDAILNSLTDLLVTPFTPPPSILVKNPAPTVKLTLIQFLEKNGKADIGNKIIVDKEGNPAFRAANQFDPASSEARLEYAVTLLNNFSTAITASIDLKGAFPGGGKLSSILSHPLWSKDSAEAANNATAAISAAVKHFKTIVTEDAAPTPTPATPASAPATPAAKPQAGLQAIPLPAGTTGMNLTNS